MAVVHDTPREQNWLGHALTSDFCPWANRFVYWLKEPVGWFVLALAMSCLIGLYFDPVGWTIAGALALMISAGMIWPLVAIYGIKVELHPGVDAVHEGTDCDMVLSIRNRLPLPIWGLVVEGYLDSHPDDLDTDSLPTAGLASVPPCCRGDYRMRVRPELRGHYPIERPKVACSFPFAIWTARKPIEESSSLTVRPKVYPITGESAFSDRARSECGSGTRKGTEGDFSGLRPYRLGDSIKQVHWIATARTDSLVVTERGSPESAAVDVWIDTESINHDSNKAAVQIEQELNRRMRIAASLITSLHQQKVPVRVQIGDQPIGQSRGDVILQQSFDKLADVPHEGSACRRWQGGKATAWISVSGCKGEPTNGAVFESTGYESTAYESIVRICNPSGVLRCGTMMGEWRASDVSDLSDVLRHFWVENGHGEAAA